MHFLQRRFILPARSPESRANLPVQPPENTPGVGPSFGQRPPERPLGGPDFGGGTRAYKATEFGTEGVIFSRGSSNLPPQDFARWPGIGYPPMAGGENQGVEGSGKEDESRRAVEQYYANYLRKKHPEHDEETIRQHVETDMQIRTFREFVEHMMKLDERIRRENPDWTTWFDVL